MVMLITKKRSVALLLSQLEKDDETTTLIKSFFQPYCDHNVVDWIKARIQANDETVISKIAELIAAPPSITISHTAGKLPVGYLIRTWCQGAVLWGEYAGTDTPTQLIISNNDPTCV